MTRRRSGEATPTLAHERNADSTSWVSPMSVAVAHHAWCADVDAQLALDDVIARRRATTPEKTAKPRKSDVHAVLVNLVLRADPQTRIADLTYQQLMIATGLSRARVATAISIAVEAGLIVNVTKAKAPTADRKGRAPQRRLDYLDQYLAASVPAYRDDKTNEPCRHGAESVPASRSGLITSLSNNAPDEADNAGCTWANRLSINVTGHLAGKQRSKPAQVRTQYGSRIRLAIGRLEDDLSPLASDDRDLVAYVADTVVDGRGNPATRRRLGERAEDLRGTP
jgi:hypothetical protein